MCTQAGCPPLDIQQSVDKRCEPKVESFDLLDRHFEWSRSDAASQEVRPRADAVVRLIGEGLNRQVQPGRGRQQVGARCCVAAYQVGGQEVRDRDLTQAQGSFALSRRLERPRPPTSWSSRLPTRSA